MNKPKLDLQRAMGVNGTSDLANSRPLLALENITVGFDVFDTTVPVVEEVWFTVNAGETVCLVGESGSGKTVTALAIARLLPSPPARYLTGHIWLEGRDVLQLPEKELRKIRGRIVSYVFQEPGASLNPVRSVGSQILETLRLHQPHLATKQEVIRLLGLVGIPAPEIRAHDYPHQMSGGIQQRVAIAMAISAGPKLLVADEPTTALDVTVQAQILELIKELQRQFGMAVLLITHNLAMVRQIADHVVVFYAGEVVESASANDLFREPYHPYTAALLRSVLVPGRRVDRLRAIPGQVPSLLDRPTGCRFHPRCEYARPDCARVRPGLVQARPGHLTRCPWHTELKLIRSKVAITA